MSAALTGAQRAHRYDLAKRILDRFARDDQALSDRVSAATPDGFGAGGDSIGSNDISDPTGTAVIARVRGHDDPARRALHLALDAIDELIAADNHRARALPPNTEKPESGDDYCAICIRVGTNNPTDTSRKWVQPNRHCSWCSGWLRDHKFDPPDWILEKRKQGRRITTADETQAITEQRRARKKKHR